MSLKDVFSSVKESFRFKKEVIIKGTAYELTVLTMGQERKVNAFLESMEKAETMEYLNELRRSIVAESLTAINGEALGKTIKVEENGKEVEKDKAIAMKDFLNELPTTVISDLFDMYVDIKEQSEEILKKEMKYDWFKTPEQRDKELADRNKKESDVEKEAKIVDVKLEKIPEVTAPTPEPVTEK